MSWTMLPTTNMSEVLTRVLAVTPPVQLKIDPITDGLKHIYQIIMFVFIIGIISLIGIGTNIANIVVFVKQGFKDSINITLLGLAVADLACVLTMFWSSICYNPLFINADLPFNSMDLMYLSGGMAHACFNRVTSFITAFITLERCLCITFPLKVKNMINPLRTKVINIAMFVVVIAMFAPFYFVNSLEWQFNPATNKSILRLANAPNKEAVETVIFSLHSVGLSTVTLLFVIICTFILIFKLNEKTKWRQSSTAKTASNNQTATAKDKKVVKMVTIISVVFIICFTPGTFNFFMMAYEPQFTFSGAYGNMFFVVWATTFAMETLSSSANIFVYLKMSTKFRVTFMATFCACVKVR